jgi:hypothetical protein
MNNFTLDLVILYINAALVIAAYLALLQIVVVQKIAKEKSKRESIAFAVEMTRFYLGEFVDVSYNSHNYRLENGISRIKSPIEVDGFFLEDYSYTVKDSSFSKAHLQLVERSKKHPELSDMDLKEMNMLETFSTPFISGVADSDAGFESVGISFCHSMEGHWYNFSMVRTKENKKVNHYSNATALYSIWKKKLKKHNLDKKAEEIQAKIKELSLK